VALGLALISLVIWAWWPLPTEPDHLAGEAPTGMEDPDSGLFPRDGQLTEIRQYPNGQLDGDRLREARAADPRSVDFGSIIFWWDAVPEQVREISVATGPQSNLHRGDYIGPESCRECHKKNYDDWLNHPHHLMNALADSDNVLGDFSGDAVLDYMDGRATFFIQNGEYRMRLERGSKKLVYHIRQTIGSRFFQYYVGRLIEGPFDDDHPYRSVNHVLPFGYWLQKKIWVPIVHVGTETADEERDDPFNPPIVPERGVDFIPYASNCSQCHTTFPLGDDLTRKPQAIAKHVPQVLHWNMGEYFREQHPELWGEIEHAADVTWEKINWFPQQLMDYEATEHAVTLGVSCEACHLGSRAHAEDPKISPDFHPHSPYLHVENELQELDTGRVHQNLNWVCARCHVGGRPQFAGGMSTWNSVEYSDAMLGSCYSQLKCIDCHSPHQATGIEWSNTPQQDDQSCLRCHSQFESAQAVQEHTHHKAESAGARCMNCHMPRINEGLQDVVRTHTIFSPTNPAMIEANHPNACNLCHTDKPIDWTLDYLAQWYGKKYSEKEIKAAYPQRKGPVAAGWMASDYEPVRLLGADAACRQNNRDLLPEIVKMLDDPFLINRQFTASRLETWLGIDLDEFGYRFYDSSSQRTDALKAIRVRILDKNGDSVGTSD
jgi:5-methylcytosine-specific restriction endonuclease McrA